MARVRLLFCNLAALVAFVFLVQGTAGANEPQVAFQPPDPSQFHDMSIGTVLLFETSVVNPNNWPILDGHINVTIGGVVYASGWMPSVATAPQYQWRITVDDNIIDSCIGGSLGVSVFAGADGAYSLDQDYVFPCSSFRWVTPMAPEIESSVCGPNNDTIRIGNQPDGIDLGNIVTTPWNENHRTVTYFASGGFRLSGTGTFSLTDANTPCEIVPPVQVEMCGPSNDMIAIPHQEAGVSWAESSWADSKKTVTFVGVTGMSLSGETEFVFEDANSACEGDGDTEHPTPTAPTSPTPVPTPNVQNPSPGGGSGLLGNGGSGGSGGNINNNTIIGDGIGGGGSGSICIDNNVINGTGGGGQGGSIYNNSVINIIDPTITNDANIIGNSTNTNNIGGDSQGGGIYNNSIINIIDPTINKNNGQGGCIIINGTIFNLYNFAVIGEGGGGGGGSYYLDSNQNPITIIYGNSIYGSSPGSPAIVYEGGGCLIVGPDGQFLTGSPINIYSTVASQKMVEPYAITVVGENNVVDLKDLPVGDFRLVIQPDREDEIEAFIRVVDSNLITGLPNTGIGSASTSTTQPGVLLAALLVSVGAAGALAVHRRRMA